MQTKKPASMLACWILAAAASMSAIGQTSIPYQPGVDTPPSLVVETVNDAQRVTLPGNTHPMALSKFETGRVEATVPMERMMLVLRRSPAQEAALQTYIAGEYDPASPNYHHWLHAEEFGRLFGPSDSDLVAVKGWLEDRGFQIGNVNKGRTLIQFTGTSAQVEQAFQVEMHHYLVHGEQHIANDRDPSIPAALSPVVAGIASLNNFFAKPQHVIGKTILIDRKTGMKTLENPQQAAPRGPQPIAHRNFGGGAAGGPAPQLTYAANSDTYEELTPYDFATIYNILPLWNASTPINGKGVTIVISGVSDISQADVTNFRSTFGLPAMTLKTIVNGPDPGADGGGGQEENSLDVEMAGATAPGAQIDIVVSGNTETTGGDMLSDEYIVDNEVAPIMSASYGQCELNLGSSGNAAYNSVWQQGATEGISIFESAGDQGSAGCSDSDEAGPNADEIGLQVNGIASSPYVTAVGGTDFTWSFVANGTATYWNSTNGTHLQTAKGIMPEVPWNSTCTNPELVPLFGAANPEQLCNGLLSYDNGFFDGLVVITGGSGGISHCTQPTGTTPGSCAGGYAKPTWQTGYGSSTTKRDLPDVSLFASGGFPSTVDGSAILFCDSVSSGSCSYTSVNGLEAQEVGGTSASSPLMAGVMALVLQKTGSVQGLANPMFYKLFAKQVTAGTDCNSSTVVNGNTCMFYDVTQGTNAQVCLTGDTNCVTNTSGDEVGILSGYTTGTGYDDATGLGTLNVANLVNNWTSTSGTPAVTLSPTSLAFASTVVGSTSTAQVVTVKNTGTATLTLTSETITGTNPASFGISANTCGSTLAASATCTVSVDFKPQATGAKTGNLSIADNASGSPHIATLSGTGTTASTYTISLTPTTLTFASTAVGATSAAQMVTVKNTGTGAVTLTSETVTGTNSAAFLISANTCGSSLAATATCTVSVEFKPPSTGAKAANLSVADNATGSPQIVTLSGTGTAAGNTVTLSPTSIAFPNTIVGKTSDAEIVTLKNTGSAAVTISAIAITGNNPASFVELSGCAGTLAASASCSIYVAFDPKSAAALTGALSVTDTATGSPQKVTLTGTGTNAPSVKLSPTSITFPTTAHGTTSEAQAVTLTNNGTATLTLLSITLTGANPADFVALDTCGPTLAAGGSCTVYVAFKPATAATFSATLSVADTGSASPQTMALSGTGN